MLNVTDQENILKSSQAANLLVQDLSELVKSSNPLLTEIAIEILEQSLQIERRLKRIESIATSAENVT